MTAADPRHPGQARTAGKSDQDLRLRQLLDLADEGNREAVLDLWREYGFMYGVDEALPNSND